MQGSKQADSNFQTSEVAPSPAPAVGRGKLVVVVQQKVWEEYEKTKILLQTCV
jgi:hypothetical protein